MKTTKSARSIAILSIKYPPVYSGYGNQLYSALNALEQLTDDYRFYILTGSYPGAKNVLDNHRSVVVLGSNFLFRHSHILAVISYAISSFCYLLINRKNIDLIHCISAHGHSALPAIWAGKIIKKKTIIKVTQAEFRETSKSINSFHRMIRKMRILLTSKATKYVAISQQVYDDLVSVKVSQETIVQIPNGVRKDIFQPVDILNKKLLRNKLNAFENEVIILFVGALTARKGIYDLIAAMKMLDCDITFPIRLILAGPDYDGICEKGLLEELNHIKVSFVGKVDNISEYYQISDVFVLLSYSEGLPNVLLEASFSRLAVVATNIGGNNDIVEDKKSGLLVTPGDIHGISSAISDLVNDISLRNELADNLYCECLEKYDISFVARKYMTLYESLIFNRTEERDVV